MTFRFLKPLLTALTVLSIFACSTNSDDEETESSGEPETSEDTGTLTLEPVTLDPGGAVFDPIGTFTFSPPEPQPVLATGYLIDSAVSGVHYVRSDGISGYTGADGDFPYFLGDTVTFSIGDTVLGSTEINGFGGLLFFTYDTDGVAIDPLTDEPVAQPVKGRSITPLDLTAGAAGAEDPAVTNKLLLLQSIDEDGYTGNGIEVSQAIRYHFTGVTLEFDKPTSEFLEDDLNPILETLSDAAVFSHNTPREAPGVIEALRHFARSSWNLNGFLLGSEPTKYEYTMWWRETGGCDRYGKSRIEVQGSLASLCPNIPGLDDCYHGFIGSDGDLMLPDMLSNQQCDLWGAVITPTPEQCVDYQKQPLTASLNITDDVISGEFQASCELGSVPDIQHLDADFVLTDTVSTLFWNNSAELRIYRQEVASEITTLTESGSCETDDQCRVHTLGGTNCGIRRHWPYSTESTDMGQLDFLSHVYDEVEDEIRSNEPYYSGFTICYQPRYFAACLDNTCQLED